MQARDGENGYGWVSIALHWVAAAFIFYQYFDGEAMHNAVNEMEEAILKASHISTGMLAFLFLASRIVWRVREGEQQLPPAPKLLSLLAKWVPKLLMLSIAILIITGPLHIWSKGEALQFFDLFSLPSPLPKMLWLHELTEDIHGIAGHSVFYLSILHILGSLKHLFIDKDGVMQRMLIPRK